MRKEVPELPGRFVEVGGIYKHFKGNDYKVVAFAFHSDGEWMVVYEPMYNNPVSNLFTRPLSEWFNVIESENGKVERFTLVTGDSL